MTDLIVSILILAAYLMAVLAWHLRHKQLDRNRAARQRIRRINAYTMARRSNVIDLHHYSRKVDAA